VTVLYDAMTNKKCCGSVTLWYESGSSDPYLCLTDPDADPGGKKHTDATDPDPVH
jgi:hypothetical protein